MTLLWHKQTKKTYFLVMTEIEELSKIVSESGQVDEVSWWLLWWHHVRFIISWGHCALLCLSYNPNYVEHWWSGSSNRHNLKIWYKSGDVINTITRKKIIILPFLNAKCLPDIIYFCSGRVITRPHAVCVKIKIF